MVVLIALEGNDVASLHLLQHVWPDAEVQALLRNSRVLALRVDGGSRAQQGAARWWEGQLSTGGALPSLVLLHGARGCVCVRERRLDPSYLATKLRAALDAVESEVLTAQLTARAESLLGEYMYASARDFRPPTPPPTQQELDRAYAAELDAAYRASEEEDARREAERSAAAEAAEAKRAEVEEAAEVERRAVAEHEEELERARVAAADAAAARREWRLCTASLVPPEPEYGGASVAVRMRDGRRIVRRFEASSPLQLVADWVGGEAADMGAFALASHYPRRRLEDLSQTLEALGMANGATLFVEEDDDDEEDVE